MSLIHIHTVQYMQIHIHSHSIIVSTCGYGARNGVCIHNYTEAELLEIFVLSPCNHSNLNRPDTMKREIRFDG